MQGLGTHHGTHSAHHLAKANVNLCGLHPLFYVDKAGGDKQLLAEAPLWNERAHQDEVLQSHLKCLGV